jgi:SAM-dependent methyltransferase
VESSSFAYGGTELSALAEAHNYYRWVISQFAPFLGKRVIEVGAGIGTFAHALLAHTPPSELLLFEPGDNLFPLLQRRFAADSRVKVVHGYFQRLATPLTADSIVLVNVLEHIAEDHTLLDDAREVLTSRGTLLLLVPALPHIYGSLDQAFGHYRRYTKSSLANKLRAAGFGVLRLSYLNSLGVAGWFLNGRVLRRTTLKTRQVRLYDRCIIPWLSRLEAWWAPPFGQSLIAIARKLETTGDASWAGKRSLGASIPAHALRQPG